MISADLLSLAFGGQVPARVLDIWPDALAERHALDFKAAPILRLNGPTRCFVSNGYEDAAFVERVASAFPDPAVRPFFTQLGADTRKIIDTDGQTAELYLDDLQRSTHDLDLPADLQWMCATLELGTGRRTAISRHGALPTTLLSAFWQTRATSLGPLQGLWGLRWHGGEVTSLLLINEQRWRGDPASSTRAIDALADPRWDACCAAARSAGLACYPDAIEFHAEAIDITIGIYDPARPSSREPR